MCGGQSASACPSLHVASVWLTGRRIRNTVEKFLLVPGKRVVEGKPTVRNSNLPGDGHRCEPPHRVASDGGELTVDVRSRIARQVDEHRRHMGSWPLFLRHDRPRPVG